MTFGLFAGFLVYALMQGYGPFGGALLSPTAAFSMCLAGRISLARGRCHLTTILLLLFFDFIDLTKAFDVINQTLFVCIAAGRVPK